MSKTMTPGMALDIVSLRFPRLLTDGVGARFADEVQARMWHRYPWRDSVAELPPFHLTVEEGDYGPPLLAVPPDLHGLYDVWVRNSNADVYPLIVRKNLRVALITAIPDTISYQPEVPCFRLFPRPSVGGADWWVEGTYKKSPTKITNANVNSYILPWDDTYFEVFRQGLIWKVKKDLLGDPRASEELALFDYMIDGMAAAEDLLTGVTIVAPAEGLELGG